MKLFAKKRNKIILLLVFALILIVYFVYATVISFKLNDILKNAENRVPFNKKYINIIDENNYNKLMHEKPEGESVYATNAVRKMEHTFPYVLPFIFNNTSFRYTYEIRDIDTGEIIHGSFKVHVNLSLKYGLGYFYIYDVNENP